MAGRNAPAKDEDIDAAPGSNREFLVGLGRAVAGALIFSIPMLMTMELWWLGFYVDPFRFALLLVLLLPVLLGLSRIGGFRRNAHWVDDVADVFVAIAVAFITGAFFMWLFGLITPEMPIREIAGKVAMQAFPASIGAMLAQNQLGSGSEAKAQKTYGGEIFLLAVGAIFLSLNIAPTEEIEVISYMMDAWHTIGVIAVSIILMHVIVYLVDFAGSARPDPAASFLSVFAKYTVVGYAVVALINFYLLWTFGRVDGAGTPQMLGIVATLSFPGAIGAAFARLVL